MNIHLHIERLVLEGVPAHGADSRLIGAAVETELAQLLTLGGLRSSLRGGGAWRSVPANAPISLGNHPTQAGQQIAHAVYQGIGNESFQPNERNR